MGEGQWRVDDVLAERLHELDAETERAVQAGVLCTPRCTRSRKQYAPPARSSTAPNSLPQTRSSRRSTSPSARPELSSTATN
jgi:hypothetical protein